MATSLDIPALQSRLKVEPDGQLGPVTCAALFVRLGARADVGDFLGQGAATALPRYGISGTGLRLVHFLGQISHESGGFRYMEEIASGQAYEGRADLGNVHAGDGVRYKGRSPIMLTGRSNYRRYGQLLGIDLEGDPAQAARPSIGVTIAALFWTLHNLNRLADADDIAGITRAINGGVNGLTDRIVRTLAAKALVF